MDINISGPADIQKKFKKSLKDEFLKRVFWALIIIVVLWLAGSYGWFTVKKSLYTEGIISQLEESQEKVKALLTLSDNGKESKIEKWIQIRETPIKIEQKNGILINGTIDDFRVGRKISIKVSSSALSAEIIKPNEIILK